MRVYEKAPNMYINSDNSLEDKAGSIDSLTLSYK